MPSTATPCLRSSASVTRNPRLLLNRKVFAEPWDVSSMRHHLVPWFARAIPSQGIIQASGACRPMRSPAMKGSGRNRGSRTMVRKCLALEVKPGSARTTTPWSCTSKTMRGTLVTSLPRGAESLIATAERVLSSPRGSSAIITVVSTGPGDHLNSAPERERIRLRTTLCSPLGIRRSAPSLSDDADEHFNQVLEVGNRG